MITERSQLRIADGPGERAQQVLIVCAGKLNEAAVGESGFGSARQHEADVRAGMLTRRTEAELVEPYHECVIEERRVILGHGIELGEQIGELLAVPVIDQSEPADRIVALAMGHGMVGKAVAEMRVGSTGGDSGPTARASTGHASCSTAQGRDHGLRLLSPDFGRIQTGVLTLGVDLAYQRIKGQL